MFLILSILRTMTFIKTTALPLFRKTFLRLLQKHIVAALTVKHGATITPSSMPLISQHRPLRLPQAIRAQKKFACRYI